MIPSFQFENFPLQYRVVSNCPFYFVDWRFFIFCGNKILAIRDGIYCLLGTTFCDFRLKKRNFEKGMNLIFLTIIACRKSLTLCSPNESVSVFFFFPFFVSFVVAKPWRIRAFYRSVTNRSKHIGITLGKYPAMRIPTLLLRSCSLPN